MPRAVMCRILTQYPLVVGRESAVERLKEPVIPERLGVA